MKNSILDVLGMNYTRFVLSESQLAVEHFNGQELPLWGIPSPTDPTGGLHSSASVMLKFISANMGLMKTKLDNTIQESHLIRLNRPLIAY